MAALVAIWALSRPAITDDLQPYAARVNDGAWLGVFLSVGAAIVFTAAYAAARVEVPVERRRTYALRAGGVLAVGAATALAAVLVHSGGTILDEFRGTNGKEVTQDPARLADLSASNRWTWWKEAWALFEDAPAGGNGAATFEIARRGIRVGSVVTTEPHDLPLQFLSETGIVGFLLLLGLGGAGAAAAVSALRRLEPAERAAAAALAVGVGAYAVHALVDIHWEFVAVTAPAFLSLGVLAGLGSERRASLRPGAGAVVVVVTLGALYSLVAPYASSRLVNAAYDAVATGKTRTALADGRSARWLNPLAVDPLWALGDAEAGAGAEGGALARYREAVRLQPENSSTWYALGSYEFFTGRYRAALHDLDRAYGLDPYGPAGRPGGLLDQARAKVEGR